MPRKAAKKKTMRKSSKHAKKAKSAVSKAAKHAEDLIDHAEDLFTKHKETAKGKQDEFEEQIEKVLTWIKKHPVKATAGAVAVGWTLGRLFGGKKR